MKHKKKKKGGRKIRKQKRKQKQEVQPSWLTPGANKKLKDLAKVLTFRSPRYPKEIQNKKYYCSICNRAYCINLVGDGIMYCQDCYYNGGCSNIVNDMRDCEEG